MNKIGPHAKQILFSLSPFSKLLNDLAANLLSEDTDRIKLVLLADKHMNTRQHDLIKNAASALSFMFKYGMIKPDNTEFLQQILDAIGRQDLKRMICEYNVKRSRGRSMVCHETAPKVYFTAQADAGDSFKEMPSLRLGPEGNSVVRPVDVTEVAGGIADENVLSQMSVDDAGDSPSSSQSSQMSISDDEKLTMFNDKVWPHETDDNAVANIFQL